MYCTVLARDPFVIDVSITLDECACSKGLTLDETLEYGRNLVFPQHVTRYTTTLGILYYTILYYTVLYYTIIVVYTGIY